MYSILLAIIYLAFISLGLPDSILGAAWPSLIHATPDTFGAGVSQSVIGVQMASAYVGTTFMPPVFGMLADVVGIGCYPIFLAVFLVLMVVMLEGLNNRIGVVED